ncbi:methylamine utilization protein MauJ [Vibrio sp. WXL103]|uniref:methylamine utilization protein MauJ n=1 Tax=Vibrio sp. WXL103 TaxID=3450710 RepID=UPI003EC85814
MPISIQDGIVNEKWILPYDGEEVILSIKNSLHPHSFTISNKNGFRGKEPWNIFFRVLNEIVWCHRVKVREINGLNSSYCATMNFIPNDDSYALHMDCFKQRVFSDDQHLALGFFREGVSSGSAYYEFLCYAKILEIPFKCGKSKGAWIEQQIPTLEGELARTLRDRKPHFLNGKKLEDWLRKDGRHALSHANIQGGHTVRDPNSYSDWNEIKWGNAVMHDLAVRAIKLIGIE